jgi:hypothetical protein
VSTRWEYLVVAWSLTATPPSREGEAWGLEGVYQISRPASTWVETRRYDVAQGATLAFELLNELGAEGWELVSHTIERNAVAPAQGYQTAGIPIASMQIFKRPVEPARARRSPSGAGRSTRA